MQDPRSGSPGEVQNSVRTAAGPAAGEALQALAALARRQPALELLLVFGSRARGDAGPQSDWDLGFLAGPGFDPDAMRVRVVEVLESDDVDLVDLSRAGALPRFRAARDGRVLHEARPGAFARFWLEAVDFWCDAAPLLRAGYAESLARLGR